MESSVQDLLDNCNDETVSVTTLLRLAKPLAREYKRKDFEKWIDLEQGGYDKNNLSDIPDYRKVRGIIVIHRPGQGTMMVQGQDDELIDPFRTKLIADSISKLERLHKDESSLYMEYSAKQTYALREFIINIEIDGSRSRISYDDVIQFKVIDGEVVKIIESVRNTVYMKAQAMVKKKGRSKKFIVGIITAIGFLVALMANLTTIVEKWKLIMKFFGLGG